MTCKYRIESDKLILNCDSCLNNASIGNESCLETVINNLTSEIKRVVFLKKGFKKIYSKAGMLYEFKKFKTTNPVKSYKEGDKRLYKTELIKQARKHLINKNLNYSQIYHKIFTPLILPRFVKSEIQEAPQDYRLIKNYSINHSRANIYKKGLNHYYELIPVESRLNYDEISEVNDFLKNMNKEVNDLSNAEKIKVIIDKSSLNSKLKDVVSRYGNGLGLIDTIFSDDFVQDVFIDSTSINPIHIIHQDYGACITNIKLSKPDLDSISTRIRAISGRPFDDGFPVIHYDLKDKHVRVCGIREPLTFGGVGFAFRKHKTTPWTLNDFVVNGMVSLEVAGLINYLIDGQTSLLITGPRGSGKTSLLSSIIFEIPRNQRIIVIEDTPELPVNTLRSHDYKIEHLRVKPFIKDDTDDFELSPEQALRTALRLGESVLVIGEVRGPEAKSLFEAMRIGASGNVVIGTIHGSGAYDTFDRITHDLGVPSTSFKAVDIVLSCANLRIGEGYDKVRKLVGVTEVRKKWDKNPFNEGGVFELCRMGSDRVLRLSKDLRKSETLKKISELKGISVNDSIKSIKLRAKAKELLIKHNLTNSLQFQSLFNDKLTELLSTSYTGTITKLRNWMIKNKEVLKQVP